MILSGTLFAGETQAKKCYICSKLEEIKMTGKEILKKYKEPKNFFNRDLS